MSVLNLKLSVIKTPKNYTSVKLKRIFKRVKHQKLIRSKITQPYQNKR